MWIVEVVPIRRGFPKETLTYFAGEKIQEGRVVSVPIRSKPVDAIVVDCKDAKEEKAHIKSGSFALKKILKVKEGAGVPDYIFETAKMGAQYYRSLRGTMLDLLIPDYSLYGIYTHEFNEIKNLDEEDTNAQSERLLFQSPLEERVGFYRTYVRESFAKRESLILVAPTIADCELFRESLSRGIADFVVVLHSELTKKKMADTLKRLSKESHSFLIICTPSYVSLARADVGTIIIEHESSTAYATPSFPSYDFRVLLELFCRNAGRKMIMADSLLRVETLGRYENHEFGIVAPITFRALAPIQLSVIAHGAPDEIAPRARMEQIPALSNEIRTFLGNAIGKKQKIFAFALRTGLATITKCRDCGNVLACEHCSAPLVLYASGERRVFICNKCKRHTPSEQKCTRCKSWNLSPIGTGTAFVEDEIKRLFPELPVFRIDREATPTKSEARKVAGQFMTSQTGVLVGTEMALYYLDEDVTDSIIVSFDTLFNIPSYRTNERIIELFLSIAERTKNKLFVQTKRIDEPILELIQSNNYSSWYRNELDEREEYLYPPYSTIIKVTWKGKEAEKSAVADYFKEVLSPFSPDIFDGQIITKGKKETAVHAVIRPRISEWSVSLVAEKKGLSEALREALAKLPEDAIVSVNPDNLL